MSELLRFDSNEHFQSNSKKLIFFPVYSMYIRRMKLGGKIAAIASVGFIVSTSIFFLGQMKRIFRPLAWFVYRRRDLASQQKIFS